MQLKLVKLLLVYFKVPLQNLPERNEENHEIGHLFALYTSSSVIPFPCQDSVL